ncbi:MAG: RNA polymerase sigma factor [Aureliella sp.]
MNAEEFSQRYVEAYPKLNVIAAAILGSQSDAADIVQQAAVIAIKKLDSYEAGTDFTKWLAQIVRFVAANERRKRGRHREVQWEEAESLAGESDSHSSELTFSEVRRRFEGIDEEFDASVANGLRCLPDETRTCLLLKVVSGMTYDEISSLLDIPTGTVASHIHRGRKSLAAFLCESDELKGGLL